MCLASSSLNWHVMVLMVWMSSRAGLARYVRLLNWAVLVLIGGYTKSRVCCRALDVCCFGECESDHIKKTKGDGMVSSSRTVATGYSFQRCVASSAALDLFQLVQFNNLAP